jgi:Zn-dependent peptidase ImmA (M78 family)/DNA-binding XRE family transcriptional regulator
MKSKPEFNGDALIVARQSRGISQRDLAAAVGVAPSTLCKSELNSMLPSPEVLAALSRVLQYPEALFFHDINVLTPNIIYYRKRASLLGGDREKVDNLVHIERFKVRQLLLSLGLNQTTAPMNPADYGTPQDIARRLRHTWSVPMGPVKNLVQLVEKAGILIITSEYNTDKLDGMIVPDGDALPLIYLNREQPGDRQRSTLAHELGHWLMHNAFHPSADDDVEAEAFDFAGEFMVPVQEFQRQVNEKTTLATYADLKRYWRMSMQFLIKHAHRTELISDTRRTSLMQQMSKLGYRKREPRELDIIAEKPTVIDNMIRVHLKELDFTPETLQDHLGIMAHEIRARYMQESSSIMQITHRGNADDVRMIG